MPAVDHDVAFDRGAHQPRRGIALDGGEAVPAGQRAAGSVPPQAATISASAAAITTRCTSRPTSPSSIAHSPPDRRDCHRRDRQRQVDLAHRRRPARRQVDRHQYAVAHKRVAGGRGVARRHRGGGDVDGQGVGRGLRVGSDEERYQDRERTLGRPTGRRWTRGPRDSEPFRDGDLDADRGEWHTAEAGDVADHGAAGERGKFVGSRAVAAGRGGQRQRQQAGESRCPNRPPAAACTHPHPPLSIPGRRPTAARRTGAEDARSGWTSGNSARTPTRRRVDFRPVRST